MPLPLGTVAGAHVAAIQVPEEPGLGRTLNLDAVAEHVTDGESLVDPV